MKNWKTVLYERYVSTEQSSGSRKLNVQRLSDLPQFKSIIDRYLPADRSIRIADLGCGYGPLVLCLKESGYTNVVGVDVSSEQVELARSLGLDNVREGGLVEYLQNTTHTFDVIFLMDVLEHLEKQEVVDLLELVSNVLTDNGRLILHVPNAEGLFGMRIRYGDFTHQVCFTPQSIRQVLLATGYSNVDVYEDKPLVHGVKSMARRLLWNVLTARERLLLIAETGASGHILSQNMLVVSDK